jgi:hypothetical protein
VTVTVTRSRESEPTSVAVAVADADVIEAEFAVAVLDLVPLLDEPVESVPVMPPAAPVAAMMESAFFWLVQLKLCR